MNFFSKNDPDTFLFDTFEYFKDSIPIEKIKFTENSIKVINITVNFQKTLSVLRECFLISINFNQEIKDTMSCMNLQKSPLYEQNSPRYIRFIQKKLRTEISIWARTEQDIEIL